MEIARTNTKQEWLCRKISSYVCTVDGVCFNFAGYVAAYRLAV